MQRKLISHIAILLAAILIFDFWRIQAVASFDPALVKEGSIRVNGRVVDSENEIGRAVSYGFVPKEIQNRYSETITFYQFCTMVNNMLKTCNFEAISKWKVCAAVALKSKDKMNIEDGMLAIYYAAESMGIEKNTNGNWTKNIDLISDKIWDQLTWKYPKFPDWEKGTAFNNNAGWDHINAALWYCMGQYSNVSYEVIFDKLVTGQKARFRDKLTRNEAIAAVTRLYESAAVKEITFPERKRTDWDIEFLAQTEKRKETIQNNTQSIKKSDVYIAGETYTGKAFYISNKGNDGNDGLSPQTAWASPRKLDGLKLKSGDAAFFERGSLWRNECIVCKTGVTYSAYGQGEKPRFYGSPESGTDSTKWKLYYSGENGEKIWEFYRDMSECGGVVFNGGESYASREYGWWNGSENVFFDNPLEKFNVKKALSENLKFCCDIDYSENDFPIKAYDLNKKGKLYLRCDKGNPGDIYQAVEFETSAFKNWFGIVYGEYHASEFVVDNLCVLYWGKAGIQTSPENANSIVQNCEVGWGGNCIHCYMQPEPTKEYMLSGDGIYGFCDGSKVRNNYVHDIDGAGITYEICDNQIQSKGDFVCAGNLVERCGQGIRISDNKKSTFKKIYIENNYILYTGYGNCHGCWCEIAGIAGPEADTDDGTYINNNVIYLSKDALVYGWQFDKNLPTFSNNTFVQNPYGSIVEWGGKKIVGNKKALEYIKSILGDRQASVIF
jgi:hypothetical protein